MHESFDLNIRRLVAVISAFDGLTVIGGCGGHPNPQPDQWPEGSWYVMITVQRTDQGWFALEFLAWAINNDYRRGGHQVLLSPIAPPPYLNQPGQSLQFVIEGSAGANHGRSPPISLAVLILAPSPVKCCFVSKKSERSKTWSSGPSSTCRPGTPRSSCIVRRTVSRCVAR